MIKINDNIQAIFSKSNFIVLNRTNDDVGEVVAAGTYNECLHYLDYLKGRFVSPLEFEPPDGETYVICKKEALENFNKE